LPGHVSVGHVRYATQGAAPIATAHPLMAAARHGPIALAQSGSLTNANLLTVELRHTGFTFPTTTGTEVVWGLVAAHEGPSLQEAPRQAAQRLTGAFALCAMTHDRLIGLRDPLGIQPLSIGRAGSAWFLASESCAFDAVGAELVRDVRPGEMVI